VSRIARSRKKFDYRNRKYTID